MQSFLNHQTSHAIVFVDLPVSRTNKNPSLYSKIKAQTKKSPPQEIYTLIRMSVLFLFLKIPITVRGNDVLLGMADSHIYRI